MDLEKQSNYIKELQLSTGENEEDDADCVQILRKLSNCTKFRGLYQIYLKMVVFSS